MNSGTVPIDLPPGYYAYVAGMHAAQSGEARAVMVDGAVSREVVQPMEPEVRQRVVSISGGTALAHEVDCNRADPIGMEAWDRRSDLRYVQWFLSAEGAAVRRLFGWTPSRSE